MRRPPRTLPDVFCVTTGDGPTAGVIRMPDDLVVRLGIKEHPSYIGMFTDHQALGAYPNGTIVIKQRTAAGDWHRDGDQAVVLGSIYQVMHGLLYFVAWKNAPYVACSIAGDRITRRPS